MFNSYYNHIFIEIKHEYSKKASIIRTKLPIFFLLQIGYCIEWSKIKPINRTGKIRTQFNYCVGQKTKAKWLVDHAILGLNLPKTISRKSNSTSLLKLVLKPIHQCHTHSSVHLSALQVLNTTYNSIIN